MLALTRSSCCCCCWLLALLLSHAGVKAANHNKNINSIKTAPLGEAPTATAAAAAAASTHPGSVAHAPAKKSNVPVQVGYARALATGVRALFLYNSLKQMKITS